MKKVLHLEKKYIIINNRQKAKLNIQTCTSEEDISLWSSVLGHFTKRREREPYRMVFDVRIELFFNNDSTGFSLEDCACE